MQSIKGDIKMNCNCEAIKKLQDEINELKNSLNKNTTKSLTIGFEDDDIFLLSIEEYEKYKNVIPKISTWWWLRSPGLNAYYAALVDDDGSIDNSGDGVDYREYSVRPALRISNQESKYFKIGGRFVKYAFPWIKIADNIVIAEVPIAFHRFDETSNDYKNSEIRQFLLDWKSNTVECRV